MSTITGRPAKSSGDERAAVNRFIDLLNALEQAAVKHAAIDDHEAKQAALWEKLKIRKQATLAAVALGKATKS